MRATTSAALVLRTVSLPRMRPPGTCGLRLPLSTALDRYVEIAPPQFYPCEHHQLRTTQCRGLVRCRCMRYTSTCMSLLTGATCYLAGWAEAWSVARSMGERRRRRLDVGDLLAAAGIPLSSMSSESCSRRHWMRAGLVLASPGRVQQGLPLDQADIARTHRDSADSDALGRRCRRRLPGRSTGLTTTSNRSTHHQRRRTRSVFVHASTRSVNEGSRDLSRRRRRARTG